MLLAKMDSIDIIKPQSTILGSAVTVTSRETFWDTPRIKPGAPG